jgi:hypothetical protein
MDNREKKQALLEEAYGNQLLTLAEICDLFPEYSYDQHARARRRYRREHNIDVKRGGIPGKRPDQTIAEALAAGNIKLEDADTESDAAAALAALTREASPTELNVTITLDYHQFERLMATLDSIEISLRHHK